MVHHEIWAAVMKTKPCLLGHEADMNQGSRLRTVGHVSSPMREYMYGRCPTRHNQTIPRKKDDVPRLASILNHLNIQYSGGALTLTL